MGRALLRRLIDLPAAWIRGLSAAAPKTAGIARRLRPATLLTRRRPAGYPGDWEVMARLTDGRPVLLRPIRPGDAGALREGFLRLSPEDVRRRFGQTMWTLSPAALAYLTRIDYRTHMALVAVDPNGRGTAGGWGVARYVATLDPRGAELALTVRSDMQRLGIGSLLLSRLMAFAAAHGIEEIWGDVVRDNAGMLALARKFGFSVRRSPDDDRMSRISKRLNDRPRQALA